MGGTYIPLEKLLVFKLADELSEIGWDIYERLDWRDKKIMGDQFITATDSCGANIAEGYGRYHYLDRIKFYYNARASLLEVKYWVSLLFKRKKINYETHKTFIQKANHCHLQLNTYIKSCYSQKNNPST